MKKLIFLAMIFVGCFYTFSQNSKYGVTVGLQNIKLSASAQGINISDDATGFYVGGFGIFNLSSKIDFQPAIQIASVKSEGYLIFPLMFKYNIDPKFNIQAGPQLTYFLGQTEDQGLKILKPFSLGIAFGAAIDIVKDVFVEARYNIGLTDISGSDISEMGTSLKLDGFQIGIGYKFK